MVDASPYSRSAFRHPTAMSTTNQVRTLAKGGGAILDSPEFGVISVTIPTTNPASSPSRMANAKRPGRRAVDHDA
jgi:hypothetical protein